VIADYNLTLGDLMGVLSAFFERLGSLYNLLSSQISLSLPLLPCSLSLFLSPPFKELLLLLLP
jgi:hypothetical protein